MEMGVEPCTSDTMEDAGPISCLYMVNREITKKLALLKEEELKSNKSGKPLKIIDECKLHGGHITLDSLDHVNELTEKQLYWLKSYSTDALQLRTSGK